jgi:hypothetical protein
MGNIENTIPGDVRFQALLDGYMRLRARQNSVSETADHLDEDTLSAFTEGNLTMREADPIVTHLSDCSFCRHKTAELVRLELTFSEMDVAPAVEPEAGTSRVSEVMNGILQKLFGGNEAAVFAHEEKPEDETEEDADEETKD